MCNRRLFHALLHNEYPKRCGDFVIEYLGWLYYTKYLDIWLFFCNRSIHSPPITKLSAKNDEIFVIQVLGGFYYKIKACWRRVLCNRRLWQALLQNLSKNSCFQVSGERRRCQENRGIPQRSEDMPRKFLDTSLTDKPIKECFPAENRPSSLS